jgi:NTE family protein
MASRYTPLESVRCMPCRSKTWLCSALLLLAASPSSAEDRPKIGLVLEGGGALGLAHIGVIRWLEEHRIPVDMVGGTSMGGLVGGLYAMGNGPAEIRKLVDAVNWDDVLRGQTPYSDLSFRRKEDRRDYPSYIELGLRHGIHLPSGLNGGREVGFIFDRAALPYGSLKSFDDLPIPFRCVATEIVSGSTHVFSEGPIEEALRSTMSLPAVFDPVKTKDGKIFADGGLLNNLPVDVVKAMGADIIIAVYLAGDPVDPKTQVSLFGVLGQSIGVMIAANERRNMEMADILITARLSGFTATDYHALPKIVEQGYEGAQNKARMLSRLSVDDATWRAYLNKRDAKRRTVVPEPKFVSVEGSSPAGNQAIQAYLESLADKPADPGEIENSLTHVAGIGRFEALDYRMTRTGEEDGLLVRVQTKDYGPPFITPSFTVDGSQYNSPRLSVGARITALDLGGFRSELRTDVSVGSTYLLSTEYFRPVKPSSRWFVAPRAFISDEEAGLYSRGTHVADYRIRRLAVGADLGFSLNRYSELRIGYQTGHEEASRGIGEQTLPEPSGRTGMSQIRYSLDHTDDPVVPLHGQRGFASFQWVDANPGSLERFPVAEAKFTEFRPVSPAASVFFSASGGSTFGHQDSGLPQFFLGGQSNFAGYAVNELLGNQYYAFRTGYLRQIGKLPTFLGNKIYGVALYDVGKVFSTFPVSRIQTDGAVGVIVQTLFGPMLLGTAVGESGHRRFVFQLGRIF